MKTKPGRFTHHLMCSGRVVPYDYEYHHKVYLQKTLHVPQSEAMKMKLDLLSRRLRQSNSVDN